MQTNEELPDDFVQEEAEYRLSQKPSPALNAYIQKYDKLNPKMLNSMGLGHVPKMIEDYRAGKMQADDPDFTDDVLIDSIEKSENISEREHASPLAKTLDLPFQATVGAARALGQSILDLPNGLGEWVAGKVVEKDGSYPQLNLPNVETVNTKVQTQNLVKSARKASKGVQLPEVAEPISGGGDFIRSVGQFVLGFGVVGTGLKAVGAVGKATSLGGKIAETALTDATTNFVAFHEHEQRLSNLIESHPQLRNPVTEFLKSDEEDGVILGRFKNSLEGVGLAGVGAGVGAGLGVFTDSFVKAVKFIKDTKTVGDGIGTLKQERKVRNTTIKKGYEDILKGLQDIPTRVKTPVTMSQMRQGTEKINWTTEDLLSGAAFKDIEAEQLKPFGIKATMLQEEAISSVRNSVPSYRVRIQAGDSDAIEEYWGEVVRLQQIDHVAKGINAKYAGGQGGANSLVYRSNSPGVKQINKIDDVLAKSDTLDRRKIVEAHMRILESSGNADNFIRSLTMTPQEKVKHVITSTFLANMLSGYSTHFVSIAGTTLNGMIVAPAERLLTAGIGSVRRAIGTKLEAQAGEKIASGFFSNLEDSTKYKEGQILFHSQMVSVIDGFRYMGNAIEGSAKSAIAEKSAGPVLSRIKKISEDAADFRFDKGIVHDEMKGFGYNAELLGLEKEGVLGSVFYHAANLHGAYTKIPGDLMATVDNILKGMFFKAEANAQAFRLAASQGLSGDALKSQWNDLFVRATLKPNADPELLKRLDAGFLSKVEAKSTYDASFSDDSVLKQIQEDSLKFSDEFTFTGEMGSVGTVAKNLRDALDTFPYIPAGTLMIPFIKTMSNMVKFVALDRGFLAPTTKQWRQDVAAGGAKAEMAYARLASGISMVGVGWYLASLDIITGGDPEEPGKKALHKAAGVKPNSVRIGDTYHDVSWLGPTSSPLLIGANIMQLMDHVEDDIDETEKESIMELMYHSAFMTASNLMDRSYAAGISKLMAAIADGDEKELQYVVNNYASILAVPNVVSQVGQTINPEMQDSQTAWESIKAKVGMGVRPRRDIFGRTVMRDPKVNDLLYPISYSKYKEDQTVAEMINAGAYIKQPNREVQNVRLTPDQYEKMMSYMEEMDVHGAIGKVVRDEVAVDKKGIPVPYSSAPRTRNALGPNGEDYYSRKRLVEITYKTFLDAAKERLISEDPDLQNKILAYKRNGFTKPAVASNDSRLLKNLGVKTLD